MTDTTTEVVCACEADIDCLACTTCEDCCNCPDDDFFNGFEMETW